MSFQRFHASAVLTSVFWGRYLARNSTRRRVGDERHGAAAALRHRLQHLRSHSQDVHYSLGSFGINEQRSRIPGHIDERIVTRIETAQRAMTMT